MPLANNRRPAPREKTFNVDLLRACQMFCVRVPNWVRGGVNAVEIDEHKMGLGLPPVRDDLACDESASDFALDISAAFSFYGSFAGKFFQY